MDEKWRAEVLRLYSEQEELQKKLDIALEELRHACSHESIIGYEPYYEGRRICLYCSLEEKWPYEKLSKSIAVIKTSNILRLVEYRKLHPITKIIFPLVV